MQACQWYSWTHKNSETNNPHKFVLNLLQRLDLRSSNKHAAFEKLATYYKWTNITKQYQNNKLKIIAPTWNGEFEQPDGSYSVSDVQSYIKYIIKGALPGLRQFLATEISLRMMKNAFYFTSKALFVLKIFKFLSWLFRHAAERLDKKDQVNFKFYDVTS